MKLRLAFALILPLCVPPLLMAKEPAEPNKPASPASKTVLRLDFETDPAQLPYSASLDAGAKLQGIGPTGEFFTGMPAQNQALVLDGQGARVRIADSKEAINLDFNLDDAITIEAWVKLDKLASGANVYVVGKGRTYENSRAENQNYALRLTSAGGEARPSFLFATRSESGSEDNKEGNSESVYHRWTTDRGFAPDGAWHHIAVSYRFGTPDSVAGYVDGEKVKGKWDMGGPTKAAPIVDDDAVWIGSSRGGDKGNSLSGAVDDLVIHRELVAAKELIERRRPIAKPPEFPSDHQDQQVTITLHRGPTSHSTWPAKIPSVERSFTTAQLAFHRLPMQYLPGGLREPWKGPLLLRAFCRTELPAGEMTWLVRSPGLSRLWIDGEVVLTTPAHPLFPDAHQPFEVYQADNPWLRVPRAGDTEIRKTIKLDAGKHDIVLEQIVGAKNIRCETGDTTVAVRRGDELFTIMAPVPFEIPLSDEGWQRSVGQLEQQLTAMDRQLRHTTTIQENEFWDKRHQVAKTQLAQQPKVEVPSATPGFDELSEVDRFINPTLVDLADAKRVNNRTSDAVFIRRLYLDTVGVLPSAEQTRNFVADAAADKRIKLIDQLLADERFADHWTSYWQDVLAENPSILKPTLNNTGPFRWWIYDALVENKPMDRFVTELIRMEGDKLGGAPAGFAMASENDVPMAAKAHILTAAFLGVEMKCARCHDSPYHPWTQKQLFGLAAMLDNKAIKVPATSSVPKDFFERKKQDHPIELSIFPGDEIQPEWPFTDLIAEQPSSEMLGRENAARELLAAYVTSPKNERFAEVLVNRLWQRVMGWGMVTNLSDWHGQPKHHEQLLKYLSRQFVANGYDARQLMRMIFNSQAYQRIAVDGETVDNKLAHAAPWIRRLSAEQVVDSLHQVAGLSLGTEEITFDPSTQQNFDAFLNLGVATRAWQLTSLSNERDRPSLSLPKAAIVVECLEAFGWRGSRQEPVSHRETDANMVQPGVVANSAMSIKLSRMTDDSYFTQLALNAKTPEEFVQTAFEQVLSREPSSAELQTFVEQIKPEWDTRIASLSVPVASPQPHRGFVTWANHFDIRANQLMRDVEREIAAGPAPSARIKASWRERAEDAIWALLNTPEFQFVP